MDYNMDDDIEVIVEDTNIQLERENKLVSDLMESLDYEPGQEKNEEFLQDVKKETKISSDCGLENVNFPDAVESHERGLIRLVYPKIPIIIVETEDEWKRRQFNEKMPEEREGNSSPEEKMRQDKQSSKQEDLDFEIKMEHFQKELSEVVKDDTNTQAKNKGGLTSILDELESQMENETFESHGEGKNEENIEEEIETQVRDSVKGQRFCSTSGHEVNCDISECLINMTCNTSVSAEKCGLDSENSTLSSETTIMDNLVLDGQIESERSELVQVVVEECINGPEDCFSDNPNNIDSATSEDLNYTTKLSHKPEGETNTTVLDPRGQNPEILFTSDDIFEMEDDVTCEHQEGGSIHELHHPPNCVLDRSQEQVMDNVDALTGSLSGTLSRNNVEDEAVADLGTDLRGRNPEERFELPVFISNGSDDRTEDDLLDDKKELTAGIDRDKLSKTMSRKGEVRTENYEEGLKNAADDISTAKDKEKTSENRTFENILNQNEIERDVRREIEEKLNEVSDYGFNMEEKNLISFEDDDEVPNAGVFTGTTMRKENDGQEIFGFLNDKPTGTSCVENEESFYLRNNNETQGNFYVESDMLFEERKNEDEFQVAEMNFEKKKNEREVEKEKDGFEDDGRVSSVPEIGMLVEIMPYCGESVENSGPEAAGSSTGNFENTDDINNSCEDQILSTTQTCTNMNKDGASKTKISSDAGKEEQAEHNIRECIKGKEKTKDFNEDVTSCKQVAEHFCTSYDDSNEDSGSESTAQSHGIQTLTDGINNVQIEEEDEIVEKKIEPVFSGSTKRQREQGTEPEVRLKKLKIDDTSEEEEEKSWDTKKSQSTVFNFSKEQNETQARDDTVCERDECDNTVVERECCERLEQLDIRRNDNEEQQDTSDTERHSFTSQEAGAKDEPRNGRILINLEDNGNVECDVGTRENQTSACVAEQEVVPEVFDKSRELESLERLDDLNNELIIFDNTAFGETDNVSPCCHGDTNSAGNESDENDTKGNYGTFEEETSNFEDEKPQQELQLTENCVVTRIVDESSAINADSVQVLSDHLNELLIDQKENDSEETLDEEPLEQTTAESRHEVTQELKQDVIERVTQNTGQQEQGCPNVLEIEEEVEGYVTQRDEQRVTQDVKQDVAMKVTLDTEQEEQTCLKDLEIISPVEQKFEGYEAQKEESVAQGSNQDLQGTEQKKQTLPLSPIETILEVKGCVTQGETVTQELAHAKQAQDIDQEVDKEKAQEVLQENDLEEERTVTQEEKKRVTQDVQQTIIPDDDQDVTQDAAPVKTSNQVGTEVVQSVMQDDIHENSSSNQETRKNSEKEKAKVVTLGFTPEVQRDVTHIIKGPKPEHEVSQPVEQEMTQLTQQVKQEKDENVESEGKDFKMHREKEELPLESEQEVTQGQEVTQQVEEKVTQAEKVKEQVMPAEVTREYEHDKQIETEIEVTEKENKTITKLDRNENETQDAKEDCKELSIIKDVRQLEKEDVNQGQEDDVTDEVDGLITLPSIIKRKLKRAQKEKAGKELEEKTLENRRQDESKLHQKEEQGSEFFRGGEMNEQQQAELKELEKEIEDLGITFDALENRIEIPETESKCPELSQEEGEIIEYKSWETTRENEMISPQELEKNEERENRIRSFEMLIHLETIIKEMEVYRCEQNRLRESFKICMNEIMNNLSSMTKAVQLMETRLNQKIKDAHEDLKKCCVGNQETTKLSMDALLKSYSLTQSQFGDLKHRVKDLEIICTALNISEMKDEVSNQVTAEIDAMDKRVRFTENDISDLRLRVTELEAECSSLRKLTPISEEQLEFEAGKRDQERAVGSFYKYNMEINETRGENHLTRTRGSFSEELSISRSSPVISCGQRYYGLHSEEV